MPFNQFKEPILIPISNIFMRIDYFIARKLQFRDSTSFTRIIVRVAMGAVGISLAVVLLTSSLIKGFKEEIRSKVFGFWGHIHITHVDSERSVEAIPLRLDDKLLDSILSINQLEYFQSNGNRGLHEPPELRKRFTKGGVKHVQRFINLPGLLYGKSGYDGIFIKGVGEEFNWEAMQDWLVEGNVPNLDGEEGSRDILISQIISERLKLAVGEKVIVHFIQNSKELKKRFTVSGIYNTGLQEYDRKFTLVDLRTLQETLGWSENMVGGLEVFADNLKDLDPINDYIYTKVLPTNMYSQTIRSRFPAIFEWLDLQDINEWVLMGILLIVAFINMVTVLIILILERTKMIGILKSLGSTDKQVQRIFLRLGLRIIIGGLVIGNILAIGIGYLQQKFHFIRLNEADYYLNYAPVHFDLIKILSINAGTIILIFMFLSLPVLLINRIDPVRALKFD